MNERAIRYPDFGTLVKINQSVVSLTGGQHSFEEDDERRARLLLSKVEREANYENRPESMVRKVSLLFYGIAFGRYFLEGNKRTALVVARSFLKLNEFDIDITSKELEKLLDETGMGKTNLSELTEVIRRLIRK